MAVFLCMLVDRDVPGAGGAKLSRLRDTLESVALELARMAAKGQGQTDILLGRARRVRQRLHQGMPEGWTSGR